MNDTEIKEGYKVETYDYTSDFLFLTLKEKRGVLKNAKHLLKLQKDVEIVGVLYCEKQGRMSL